ncbi:MAG TPA: cation transporter [Firmicutes bacterium]|nr:cation transporter [Bacillota bacterium]
MSQEDGMDHYNDISRNNEEVHRHDHEHHHAENDRSGESTARLGIVFALVVVFMFVEAVAGWLTNSLALLADAGHMLTDAGAIALALFASWLSRRPSGPQRTYGYYRAEILAALANAVTLIVIVVFIVIEAYHRLAEPPTVMGLPMMAVASVGLVVNLIGMWILGGNHGHDHGRQGLNLQGVLWHIIGDALGSIAAIVGGLLVWWQGWYWADPLVSVLISLIILYGGVRLVLKSVSVLMEVSPARIDVREVQHALKQLPGVVECHDLHIWTVTSGLESLSVHLVVEPFPADDDFLTRARELLHERFALNHVTIQVESIGFSHVECDFV